MKKLLLKTLYAKRDKVASYEPYKPMSTSKKAIYKAILYGIYKLATRHNYADVATYCKDIILETKSSSVYSRIAVNTYTAIIDYLSARDDSNRA